MKSFAATLLGLMLTCATGAAAHPGLESKLALLDPLIASNPGDPALYIARGVIYSRHGELERALEDLQRAQALGDPVSVAFELGVLYYRMGEYSRSRLLLGNWLAGHPGHSEALLYRARAASADGDPRAAAADYRTYLADAAAPNPGDYLAAARLLATEDSAGTGPALQLLDQGMKRLGIVPQLQRYAVELDIERGDVEAALQRWRLMQRALGAGPEWKVGMAELLMRAGRSAQAAVVLHDAREQLRALKPTPSRQRLLERIELLDTRGPAAQIAKAQPLPT